LRFLPDLRRNDGSFAPYATILNVREIYQLVRPKANHPVLWHPELNAGKLEIVSVRLLTAASAVNSRWVRGRLKFIPRKFIPRIYSPLPTRCPLPFSIAGAEIRQHGQRGFGRRCQIRYLNAFKPEIVSLNHRCHLCSGLSLASRGSYGSSSCPICLFLTSITIRPKCSWCGCHTCTSSIRTSTHSTNLLRISVSPSVNGAKTRSITLDMARTRMSMSLQRATTESRGLAALHS
jgi:hypothetical protein